MGYVPGTTGAWASASDSSEVVYLDFHDRDAVLKCHDLTPEVAREVHKELDKLIDGGLI